MKPAALLLMILSNVVWSANPLFAKRVLTAFTAPELTVLRYGAALIGFLLLFPLLRWVSPRLPEGARAAVAPPWTALRPRRSEWSGYLWMGAATFCAAPYLAYFGLQLTRATDAALIIAFEPLSVSLLSWLFLGERPSSRIWTGFVIAALGFSALSLGRPELSNAAPELTTGSSFGDLYPLSLWGNVLVLASLLGEGAYSIVGRRLLNAGASPVRMFLWALISGWVLSFVLCVAIDGAPDLRLLTTPMVWALLWLGVLGTTAGYLLWLVVMQGEVPIAAIALTLFLQPVLGAVWGMAFLGERLGGVQWLGAALILLGIASQIRPTRAHVDLPQK